MRRWASLLLALVATLLWGCDGSGAGGESYNDGNSIPTNSGDGTGDEVVHITLIEPVHGPVSGGTVVTVRGFGFADGARVFFGSRVAPKEFTSVISQDRIVCVSPPGEMGPVDVTVQNPDGSKAVLEGGFLYDRFSIDPDSGPSAGGTYVRITSPGGEFTDHTEFHLGDATLVDVRIVSPTLATAVTPPHQAGKVDLTVLSGDTTPLTVKDAFEYHDSADPAFGGFGGTAIDGQLTITVLDVYSRAPVSQAFVLLGTNPQSTFAAYTDEHGQVVFTSPDLRGSQMVTVAKEGYQNSTFVGFNRSEVTVFLYPVTPPPSTGDGFPTFPKPSYGHVLGRIYFQKEEYQGTCRWDVALPDPPGDGYRRVIRIHQTLSSYAVPSPEILRIYEETTDCVEGYGLPFELTVWPGMMTLYAEAGWESPDGKTFVPRLFGMVRNVVVGAEEEVTVEVPIVYQLSSSYSFTLDSPPPLAPEGPDSYEVKLFFDMGSDGFLVRSSASTSTTDASDTIVFTSQPRTAGPLHDAAVAVYAEARSDGEYPFSYVLVDPVDGPPWPATIGPWLDIPTPVQPADGEELVDGRIALAGGNGLTPTFHYIKMNTFPSGDTVWRIYVNGRIRSFRIPDLSGVEGVPQIPPTRMYMHVLSVYVPSLTFDTFTYRYLSPVYHMAEAADGVLFTF